MTGQDSNLSRILNRPEEELAAPGENGDVSHQMGAETLPDHIAQALYAESHARSQAEARAIDQQGRLLVARQQLAEYADQKQEDASILAKEARELEEFVQTCASTLGDSEIAEKLLACASQLKANLADAAEEARAFSIQQKKDLEKDQGAAQVETDEGVETELEEREDRECKSIQDDRMDIVEDDGEDKVSFAARSLMEERCKYIPLRLKYEERNSLRLLEAAMNVSEYTDKVDILNWSRKSQRVETQIKRICAILSGLVVAQDYRKGQKLVQGHEFNDNALFFQEIFEIGRRYKIMNPDKMRSEYGKLIYMLMDSTDSQIREMLGFDCVVPLNTVHRILSEKDGLALLSDPMIECATADIVVGNRPRYQVQQAIRDKETAREHLAKKYASYNLKADEILTCLYSISDNNSFLVYNRDPIDRMIQYLKTFFGPGASDSDTSLSISSGKDGARLTHNHERQYDYVLQTLMLWREISTDMFKLWCLAETDLLSAGNSGRLTDTGQGLNRVQQANKVRGAVYDIIDRCKRKIGHWVGSSVVHLGDHNVPNALMFIDKYTQVPRILNPVVLVLDEIPKLNQSSKMKHYIETAFGGPDECRKSILSDFFRHAFDGSGADNFFDAGSCIDGRLTSAWNWCSKIERKPYYHIFKVAGFVGFDGDFQK